MLERVEIERATELAVDAHEQVLVECGGHAERIVVGELQLAVGFDEIGAEQQKISGLQHVANASQERRAPPGVSKLPMFDPSSSTSIEPVRRRARVRHAEARLRTWIDGRRPRRAVAASAAARSARAPATRYQ